MSYSLKHVPAITFAASILLTIVSGCHTTYVQGSAPPRPVEHAPVVVHKYTYVHYPSCNVYCDRERNLWFWFEAGEWRMGVALPVQYHVVETEAVTIQLERETPYEHVHAAPPPPPPQPPPQVLVEHGPPPHAQAHGFHRKFTYVHYPTLNVYCDRERKMWFWYEGGAWRSGAALPPRFRVNEREAVRVELEAETPYEHGNAHMAHDNGKGHGKDHDGDERTVTRHGDDNDSHGNGHGKSDDSFHAKHGDAAPTNDHDTGNHGSSDDKNKRWSDDDRKSSHDDKANGSGGDNAKGSGDDKGNGSSQGNGNGSNADKNKGASGDKGNASGGDKGNASGGDKGKDKGNGPSKGSGTSGSQDKGSGVTPGNDPKNGDASDDDGDGKGNSSNGNSDSDNGKGNGKGKGKGKDKGKPDNG